MTSESIVWQGGKILFDRAGKVTFCDHCPCWPRQITATISGVTFCTGRQDIQFIDLSGDIDYQVTDYPGSVTMTYEGPDNIIESKDDGRWLGVMGSISATVYRRNRDDVRATYQGDIIAELRSSPRISDGKARLLVYSEWAPGLENPTDITYAFDATIEPASLSPFLAAAQNTINQCGYEYTDSGYPRYENQIYPFWAHGGSATFS